MKILAYFFIFCTDLTCVSAFETKVNSSSKSSIFLSSRPDSISWNKTQHDFGTIERGVIVETSFICYNGNDTLIIENVQASCGCVVPDWKRTPIMPNDSTVIKVFFDTKGKSGQHTKVITVYSSQGLYELIVKANIIKE